MTLILNGIDVSNLQGASFNWEPYKGRIEFAFIKVSEGTGFADADAARNAVQARSIGVTRGFYHFLHPSQSGTAQAVYFLALAHAAGMGPGDLTMIDVEVADGLGAAEVAACAAQFAAEVRGVTGARPVVYTMQSFAEGGYCAGLGACPAFIANPSHVSLPSPIGPWTTVSFEQTGQRGVDTDVFYGDASQLAALAIPHPKPQTASTVEVDVQLPVLRQGSQSQQVRNWQALLVAHGYGYMIAPTMTGAHVMSAEAAAGIDGVFGAKTREATVKLQSDFKISADPAGTVGAATWERVLG